MRFLERESPLAELTAWWSEARAGHGCFALISGEAGIGKSAVVRELERRIDGRTVVGACDPLSTPRPLGPLLDIAPQIGGALLHQVAAGARVDAIFATLVTALANAAEPTLIVVEDVHWADASSLDMLRFLGRRIGRLRAMLVATYRQDEVGPGHPVQTMLGDLASAESMRRIALRSLSIDAVRLLAAGSGIDAGELYRRSCGNPFFVTEVLAEPEVPVPATIRDAVMARVARLADDERAALEAASVLGARVRRAWVDAMVGRHDALATSLARGLVYEAGELVAFRHELAREALVSGMTAAQRRNWHARALAALVADPRARRTELAALSHHAEGAGDPVAVREYAVAAAREAARLSAHRQAAQQYERAHRHAESDDGPEYATLLESHAHERFLTDEPERAIELRTQAAEIWLRLGDCRRHGDNLRWLSRVSGIAGRADDAWDYARRAIEVLQPHGNGRELAAAYSNLSQLHMLADEVAPAVRWGRKAIALARRIGDVEIENHARNSVAVARAHSGDPAGLGELERSLARGREARLEEHIGRTLTNLSSVLVTTRELSRASPVLSEGLAFTEEHDLHAWYLYMRGLQAIALLHSGQLSDAIDTSRRLIERPALSFVNRIRPLAVLGRARARRGDADVWPPLDEALALASRMRDLRCIGQVRIARAEAAWLAGDTEIARREAHAALPAARQRRAPWLAGELMFLLALTGEIVKPAPWVARPFALYLRRRFSAAAQAWAALGCPYEHAWSIAAGDPDTGLRTAFQMLERLGMPAAAARAAESLRVRGARRIPRGRRAVNRMNPAGLTTREVEVLALIAEGLRNAEIGHRLFISPKTVDHHVTAILDKIDVGDRRAAACWYHQHGQVAVQDEKARRALT